MNILSLIQDQVTPQTIGQVSQAVGETPEATTSALGTAFPAVLGSIVGKSNASPTGATEILNMISQVQNQGGSGGWSDIIGRVLHGGGAPAGAPQQQSPHQSLLGSLLGSKLGPVSDFISSRSGVRGSSATSLLGMAAPMLMGVIGKFISSKGLGATGLSQLLSSQTPYLRETVPPGLANTLGIGNLLSSAPKVEPLPSARQPEHAPSGTGAFKWAIAALALGLIGWMAINRAKRHSDVGGTAPASGNAVISGRDYRAPDFSQLNLSPGGIGDNLARIISLGDRRGTVELPDFTQADGSLTDSANNSLREIRSVLAASPNTTIQITGGGDSEEAGLKQANAIKNALVAAGVADNRISTRGRTGTSTPSIGLTR